MTRPTNAGTPAGRAKLWGPVAAYALLLLVGSAMPEPPAAPGDVSDRTLHAVAYAGLALLWLRALAGARLSAITARRAALAACAAAVYGLAIEMVQWFLPERFFELSDLVANTLGAALAVTVVYAAVRAFGSSRRSPRRSSHDDVPSTDHT